MSENRCMNDDIWQCPGCPGYCMRDDVSNRCVRCPNCDYKRSKISSFLRTACMNGLVIIIANNLRPIDLAIYRKCGISSSVGIACVNGLATIVANNLRTIDLGVLLLLHHASICKLSHLGRSIPPYDSSLNEFMLVDEEEVLHCLEKSAAIELTLSATKQVQLPL